MMNESMTRQDSELLAIREGFRVHDAHGNDIGSVKMVRYSDEDTRTQAPETATETVTTDRRDDVVTVFADVFRDTENVPDELRERLLHEGFIRINRGFLRADKLATMDQVSSVSDETVHLNVDVDGLISI